MSCSHLPEVEKIENSKLVSRKSGRGCSREVVVYKRFQYKIFTENILGVLERTGRTWKFDCILWSLKK